jgi:D-sedoheptulose 7-phosphate isomerase
MRTLEEIGAEHRQVLDATLPALAEPFSAAVARCASALAAGHKILICGNGGSAADAQHFVGELVCRYERDRPGLAALALTTDSTTLTAVANDDCFAQVFARQVSALGLPGDVLLALSTSGNSPNVLAAARAAHARDLVVVALTGEGGGALGPLADVLLAVPHARTARIQEMHGLCLHALAELLEAGV